MKCQLTSDLDRVLRSVPANLPVRRGLRAGIGEIIRDRDAFHDIVATVVSVDHNVLDARDVLVEGPATNCLKSSRVVSISVVLMWTKGLTMHKVVEGPVIFSFATNRLADVDGLNEDGHVEMVLAEDYSS